MFAPVDSEVLNELLDEHAIVSVTDASGSITYANRKFIEISGYTLPELLGQNHSMLKSGMHSPAFYQQLWDTLLLGKSWHGEVCNRRKDGSLYWVRASVKPLLDEQGLPVQYISMRTDITEIKQAQHDAHRSQLMLHSAIDTIPDLIFFKDSEGKYLGCNRAFERYFGAAEAEIIGKTDFDFVDHQTAMHFRQMDRRMLATGQPQLNEEKLTYPDGREVVVEVLKSPYHYGADAPGVVGIAHDMTEHQQQMLALKASDERRAFAIEGAGDGVWDWEMPSGKMLLSRLYEAMLGYDEHELPQTVDAWIKSVHTDDLVRVQSTLQAYLAGGVPQYIVELRLQCKSGGYKWVLCRGTVVERDEQGHPVRMIGIHSDISERKENERQLELFREMIENTGQPVFMIDVEDGYRLVYVNQAACRHWGASREELLTWRLPDWDPTFDMQKAAAQFSLMLGKPGVMLETKHRLRDGRIVPVDVFSNARVIGGRSYTFGSFQNITVRKKSEEALRSAKESAEAASKAKSTFLANMSHELRTPMNAILGFAQLMESDPLTSDDQRENLQYISKAGWHLLDLINEVLDLAKVESGEIELTIDNINPADIISECLSLVSPLLSHKKIVVVNSLLAGVPNVSADYLRLKQVLINLLSNAIKYNRDGGQVEMGLADAGNGMVVISVRDTGRGMTPDEIEHLFEPFTRFGDAGQVQGTGIGLSICKNLIECMHGQILVESTMDVGSRFSIVLPSGAASDKPVITEPGLRTLLYIEDDVVQQSLIGKWARNQGWMIEFAHDAASGIDAAMKCRHDAILLDIELAAGFNGLDVKAVLDDMESLRGVPVIGISNMVQPHDIETAMQAGFSAYLAKPVDLMELERVIQRVLRVREATK